LTLLKTLFKREGKLKKCIYCSKELSEDIPLDVCSTCGFQVWGEKMYNTIVQNMSEARDDGNLHQGSITDNSSELEPNPQNVQTTQESFNSRPGVTSFSNSFVQNAVQNQSDIDSQKDSDLKKIQEIQAQTGIDPEKEIIEIR
jgi:uncharacterized UBP type Zn finger protein